MRSIPLDPAAPAVTFSGNGRRNGSAGGSAFGAPFWFTYAANSTMMTAISLLFRYGDFVKQLGGTEWNLGWIVCAGMVGSLVMRLAQGVGIDTYGPRQVWLLSSFLFVVSCAGHLQVTRVDGPLIFALRILFQTSIAGFFGASITYISGRAPMARMAEVIGTLGTSGFVGMVVGTSLGDVLVTPETIRDGQVGRIFVAATALGSAGFVLSWLATRGQPPHPRRKAAPVLWMLRRFHPGAGLLLVGVAMGFGLGLPGIFLSRYAASLGIMDIAVFFGVYAPMAFATRLAIRRLPEKVGIRPMILLGLSSLVTSMFLFLTVRSQWHFALPALFIGVAHACLFPSVVAGGTGTFPMRYRGLGTTVMLATFDLGNLIGSPTVGEILHRSAQGGLPPYPTMFVTVAVLLGSVTGVYAWLSRPGRTVADAPRPAGRKRPRTRRGDDATTRRSGDAAKKSRKLRTSN